MLDVKAILDTQKSRLNFLKGLLYFANANGIIEESEMVFFNNAAIALELENCHIEKLNDLSSSKGEEYDIEFDTNRQKLFFLREAIQLCYIDGKYDEKEKKITSAIAKKLGIDRDTINKVENWVIEGISWSKQGEELIEMEA